MSQWGYGMQWVLARVTRVLRVLRGGDIHFDHLVAVGGGGIHEITAAGISSITDAGAAGLVPLTYNPTTNAMSYGSGVYHIEIEPAQGRTFLYGGDSQINLHNTAGIITNVGGAFGVDTLTALGRLATGWLLAKGNVFDVGDDFTHTAWAAAAAPGVDLISAIAAGGSIAAVAGARGGVYRLNTVITTPTTMQGVNANYSAQDAYRIYTRFANSTVAACLYAVGVCDVLPAAGAGSAPYTNDAVLVVQDDSVGANWLLRTVVGAAVTDVDSTVAVVAGEYVQFDIIVATTRVATLYINGTLRATSVAANSPLAATMLRPVLQSQNQGAAVNASLDIDCYKIVQSRNTAVTA